MNGTRVALVTGASRGIGAAIAERLARDGFTVLINHRDSEPAAEGVQQTIRSNGGRADVIQGNVAVLADARRITAHIRKTFGSLNVLINNAGRAEDGLLLLTSHDRWWKAFEDNVGAVVNMSRAALPLLLQADGAVIVNISSISGVRGTAGQTAYSAAKAAVNGFTKALAREVGGRISVNAIAPGSIDTAMYAQITPEKREARQAQLAVPRLGRSSEVAELASLLASGRVGYIHGQVIAIDGGATM